MSSAALQSSFVGWWSRPVPVPVFFSSSQNSIGTVDIAGSGTDSSAMDDADRRDIHASVEGDGEAYRRLVERHQAFVAGRMRRFARDRTTLEELVHDVFVEAYFSLKSFRGDAPLEHWLARIATRVGYRHWKRQKAAAKTEPLTDRAMAAQSPDRAGEELQAVLAKLPPRDRLVVTLLYLDERSVAETAGLTGWSKTMVKVQAYRARGKLRKLMARSAGTGKPRPPPESERFEEGAETPPPREEKHRE